MEKSYEANYEAVAKIDSSFEREITRVLMLLTRFRYDLALRHLAHSSLKLYRFAYSTSE